MGDPGLLTPSTMGDMEIAACMADGFDKIQKLPDPVPGAPNFRRVPGFKVYCCGQPSIAGFEAVLNKVCGDIYPKDGPIIWFNLRQEPDVYVNGEPICARPPNKIGEYAELGDITRDIAKANEEEFLKVCEKRKTENGGKLKYVDINKKESEVEVKELKSLSQVIEGVKEKFPGLVHWRVPICNSAKISCCQLVPFEHSVLVCHLEHFVLDLQELHIQSQHLQSGWLEMMARIY